MFLLKLSLRPWRLAAWSQVFSGLAVGFLLLLSGFLFWLQAGLKPVVSRLSQEQVITAYLDPSVEAKNESAIVDTIKASLGAQAAKSEINLVRSDQFLKNLKKQYPDLVKEVEDLGAESAAIVPRYVSVSGLFPDQALERIRSVPGIESAETSKDRYQHIVGAFSALRWVARLLVLGLALALVTGLIHLSRTNAYLHRDAIALMRLWGAGNLSLQAPGVLSGVYVGLLGGSLAFSSWVFGAPWLERQVRALSPMLRDLPSVHSQYGLTMLLVGAGTGLLAGMFGSFAVVGSGGHSSGRG